MSESRVISQNPVDLLNQEHLHLRSLLDDYENLSPRQDLVKASLIRKIERAIEDHIATEESLFYPTLLKLNDSETRDRVARVLEGHRRMERLLADLRRVRFAPALERRCMTSLQNHIQSHLEFERNEVFPLASYLMDVTLNQLGLEIEAREMKGRPTADGTSGNLREDGEPSETSGRNSIPERS